MIACWMAAALLLQDPVSFSKGPQAVRDGGHFRIDFTLSRAADVEVAVLREDGRVIRHLAAGTLGGKSAPPAPLKAGLAQSIVWDGKDDRGIPAGTGPHRLRVRAGLSVKFGGMIGGSPYTGSVVSMPYRAPVNGLVAGPEGSLFVKMMSAVGSHGNSGMWPWQIRRFDREGKYLRTLVPYPPSVDRARASGFALDSTDEFAPLNRTSLYPVFSVLGNELVSRRVDGRLVFVHSETRELNFFSLDGTNRLRSVPMWPRDAKVNCPRWLDIQVAFSPDGKIAYYSNVAGTAYDGKQPSDIDPAWPQGRIYRHDLTREGSVPRPFHDLELPEWPATKYWMPSAWDKKTAAAGIDTDANGNVLVCDLVNHRVVEIDPAGKRLSATPVEWPDKVMVGRKTGALYVLSRKVSRGHLPPAKLRKIVGRGAAAKVVAELALTGTVGGAYTIDESGDRPVLWLAGQEKGTGVLLRIEDRGDALVSTGGNHLNRDRNAITFLGYMDVDPEAELVYVTRSGGTVWRYHGLTGEGGPLEIQAVDLAVGPGGMIYAWGTSGRYEGPVARYTRDLEPAPLKGHPSNTYGYLYGRAGRGSSVCGLDVDAEGRVFATYGSNDCHVRAYDAEGKPVPFERRITVKTRRGEAEVPVAVSGVRGYGGSIRLDPAGNIYLLQQGVPEGHRPPPGFEKDEAYRRAVGTIYKFPPTGGAFEHSGWSVTKAEGALQTYAGCGPVSRWNAVGACACTKPRFDVDGFGRLYIPNAITYSVSVRDNADNEIVRFGGYGNFDTRGPGSAEPEPAIPIGWAVTVGATDGHIYVGDCLNHRVIRVDKVFAASAVVPLR